MTNSERIDYRMQMRELNRDINEVAHPEIYEAIYHHNSDGSFTGNIKKWDDELGGFVYILWPFGTPDALLDMMREILMRHRDGKEA